MAGKRRVLPGRSVQVHGVAFYIKSCPQKPRLRKLGANRPPFNLKGGSRAVCFFFLESSFITHSTEEKARIGPEAAARPVSNSMRAVWVVPSLILLPQLSRKKVAKTKTALKQETYNLSDLKHDPNCAGVRRAWRLGLGGDLQSPFTARCVSESTQLTAQEPRATLGTEDRSDQEDWDRDPRQET
jgi:hypothetical protein